MLRFLNMKRIRSIYIILIALITTTGCKEDIRNTYSKYPAYFVCNTVSTIPQLNTALNSMGMFATIRYDRERFLFTDAEGKTTPMNATAIAGNANIQMGLSGFIVGLPNIAELGYDTPLPICYDLSCPNCYTAYNITRSLQLQESGYATCTSCHRTYDLNNQGIINKGETGISLFRYRITYSGNTMSINNR